MSIFSLLHSVDELAHLVKIAFQNCPPKMKMDIIYYCMSQLYHIYANLNKLNFIIHTFSSIFTSNVSTRYLLFPVHQRTSKSR